MPDGPTLHFRQRADADAVRGCVCVGPVPVGPVVSCTRALPSIHQLLRTRWWLEEVRESWTRRARVRAFVYRYWLHWVVNPLHIPGTRIEKGCEGVRL